MGGRGGGGGGGGLVVQLCNAWVWILYYRLYSIEWVISDFRLGTVVWTRSPKPAAGKSSNCAGTLLGFYSLAVSWKAVSTFDLGSGILE